MAQATIRARPRICTECGAHLGNLSDEQYYRVHELHRMTSDAHKTAIERAMTIAFFIPLAKDTEQAELVYDSIKQFAKQTVGCDATDKRIFSLAYGHDGRQYYAEVGKPEPREGELVIAILEMHSMPYLVCTPNRGVARGMPYLVGKNEALSLVEFVK
jgi:hypothetical protein